MARKHSWEYRYSYRSVGSLVLTGRSDDLRSITKRAQSFADLIDGRVEIYDHHEARRVAILLPGQRAEVR